jgi:fucose 4-O-acetylase-like acetyltransferase
METSKRLYCLDNLRTFMIFLVVLVHAGTVYESSGLMGPYWLVDDPSTSDLPGLINLLLDIFIMPTIFFISGYLTPTALARKGPAGFIRSKLRRLMLPWAVAVLTLMPAFKVIFLLSRGLPQQDWTTYFHFSNGGLSMSWLWFLPVLFGFDMLYVALARLRLPTARLPLGWAVAGVIALSFGWAVALGELGLIGWTKTLIADFQNERLLPYLLVFLLGSLCARRRLLEDGRRSTALYVAVNATAWIPTCAYMVLLLNFFLRPGSFIVSAAADGLLLWLSFDLAMLALLYCWVATFARFANHSGRLARMLSSLSYGVYIVHMIPLGLIALALLHTGLPALVKYPILAVTSWIATNMIVFAGRRTLAWLRRQLAGDSRRPSAHHPADVRHALDEPHGRRGLDAASSISARAADGEGTPE